MNDNKAKEEERNEKRSRNGVQMNSNVIWRRAYAMKLSEEVKRRKMCVVW